MVLGWVVKLLRGGAPCPRRGRAAWHPSRTARWRPSVSWPIFFFILTFLRRYFIFNTLKQLFLVLDLSLICFHQSNSELILIGNKSMS
jgi:hypothetical protein